MNLNRGAALELAIRRKSVSISEISRRMHVNRRSIYNWFRQENLKLDVLCEVGYIIGYDFSTDFPEEFDKNGFAHVGCMSIEERNADPPNSIHYWMNKYISLLEKYNELILHSENQENKISLKILTQLIILFAFKLYLIQNIVNFTSY